MAWRGRQQSIRSGFRAVEVPAALADVEHRLVGALLVYERFAEDRVTASRDGDEEALAVSRSAFDSAQLAVNHALAALSELGFDDCEPS